jgi:hypothetical protein
VGKRIISALLCALLAITPASAGEANPAPEAIGFVSGFSDDHLAGLLERIAGSNPEIAALAQEHGEVLVEAFYANIADAVLKHGPAWRHNMALAWTPLLSAEELSSLALGGAQSPYTEKYLALRGAAGKTMQELSQDLFQTALDEVVKNTTDLFAPQ